MPEAEKITWNDYGVNSADGEKVMLSTFDFLKLLFKVLISINVNKIRKLALSKIVIPQYSLNRVT